MLLKIWNKYVFLFLATGNANARAALEDGVAVPYKTKHLLYGPIIVLLVIHLHKLKTSVHSGT
jgi:hypothetical protein